MDNFVEERAWKTIHRSFNICSNDIDPESIIRNSPILRRALGTDENFQLRRAKSLNRLGKVYGNATENASSPKHFPHTSDHLPARALERKTALPNAIQHSSSSKHESTTRANAKCLATISEVDSMKLKCSIKNNIVMLSIAKKTTFQHIIHRISKKIQQWDKDIDLKLFKFGYVDGDGDWIKIDGEEDWFCLLVEKAVEASNRVKISARPLHQSA